MGAGLGFRRDLLQDLTQAVPACINFFELAPENWISCDPLNAKHLRSFSERYPFVAHGLSLSLGGSNPLNTDLLHAIKQFMQMHQIRLYSEHLSWCSDQGQLYDLLPIPFT